MMDSEFCAQNSLSIFVLITIDLYSLQYYDFSVTQSLDALYDIFYILERFETFYLFI